MATQVQDENAGAWNATSSALPGKTSATPARIGLQPSGGLGGLSAGKTPSKQINNGGTTTQKRRALSNISNVLQRKEAASTASASTPSGPGTGTKQRSFSTSHRKLIPKASHIEAADARAARLAALADVPVERPCGMTRADLERHMDALHEDDVKKRVEAMASRSFGMPSLSTHGGGAFRIPCEDGTAEVPAAPDVWDDGSGAISADGASGLLEMEKDLWDLP